MLKFSVYFALFAIALAALNANQLEEESEFFDDLDLDFPDQDDEERAMIEEGQMEMESEEEDSHGGMIDNIVNET